MSDELSRVYTEKWFRDRMGYRKAYHAFAQALDEVFKPESVLDVGCGAGFILEYFLKTLSGGDCLGIEGSEDAFKVMLPLVEAHVLFHDLREPPQTDLSCMDLTVCIEVAEHIEPEFVENFLGWITQTPRLFLTVAPPEQKGGLHHVNAQPQWYWIDLLGGRGFGYETELTEKWKARAKELTGGCPWVVRNAMYFERRENR